MEIRIFKVNSLEELEKAMEIIAEEELENKKDLERGSEEAEARYDRYIDLLIDYVRCVIDCGDFTKDCEIFREKMHSAPLCVKEKFFECFTLETDEAIKDISELVAEHVCLFSSEKKNCSDVKETDKKVKDSSHTKKEKENPNYKKK